MLTPSIIAATPKSAAPEAAEDRADLLEALVLCEGRIAMLLPAELPGSDHPTATHYVLARARAAIAGSGSTSVAAQVGQPIREAE